MIDLRGTHFAMKELEVKVRGPMIAWPTTETVTIFAPVVDFFVRRAISPDTADSVVNETLYSFVQSSMLKDKAIVTLRWTGSSQVFICVHETPVTSNVLC